MFGDTRKNERNSKRRTGGAQGTSGQSARRSKSARNAHAARVGRQQRQQNPSFASQLHSRLASEGVLTEGALRSTRYVFIVFAAVAIVFFLRLVFLQVIVSDEYSAQAEESRTVSFEVSARRGTIYDRNGEVLAVSVDATTIYCNPAEVTNARWEADRLHRVLGGTIEDYVELLTQDSTTFVYIERQADVDKAESVKALDLDGIYFIDEARREYPHGSVGGQVIGVCDVDGNGIAGLELQYDEILRGTAGSYSAERGETGTPIPGGVHEDTPAVDGEDIMVSIDISMQEVVENALAEQVEKYETDHGSSVLMDADTGDIYAICSYPYLDPSDLENSIIGSDNLLAITQTIEPGSIFKSVSALAVLKEDAMSAEDTIYAPAELYADEYVITDAHDREDTVYTFREILNQSSNVGISLAVDKIGFQKLYDTIVASKLNEATGVDFPGEGSPSVADVSTWAKVTGYNISFGQGLTVTPLQMVRFYGILATGGELAQPHFLLSLPQTGERVEYETETVCDDAEAIDELNDMLQSVVSDGTGKDAAITGYSVAGKTSTAEIAEEGSYAEGRYNLAFVGFLDDSNSNLVCYAGVNDVIYTGNVGAAFHDIMVKAIEQYNIVPN